MKSKRTIIMPIVLAIYLAVMSYIGYGGVERGEMPMLQYVLTVLGSAVVVEALYFVLRRREKLRREREEDMKHNSKVVR